MREILEEGFEQLNIKFTEETYHKLKVFTALLLEWNQKMNLTNIVDNKDIAIKHFLDSLTIYNYLNKKESLIDVGTGAGFPGIILKIVGYEGKITLLDSLKKRTTFLDEVIKKIELTNIETLHIRAEDGGRNKEYREKYFYATARAVAPLNILCEYCLPFVKKGGIFIAMKGSLEEEAESAIDKMGGTIVKKQRIILPKSDYHRNLIFIEKKRNTPSIYPRKAGTPTKRPL